MYVKLNRRGVMMMCHTAIKEVEGPRAGPFALLAEFVF